LCATGDIAKQKILTLSFPPGARMRACAGSLWPILAPRLRGHGPSGPADDMLVANAVCFPSGPLPWLFFLLPVIMVCCAPLPRPPGMRIGNARGAFPASNLRKKAADCCA